MDQTQSASDYKEYFSNKFVSIFNRLLDRVIEVLPDNIDEKKDLLKIKSYGEKLNFEKIIKKMEENKKLIDIINILGKNQSDDESYFVYYKNKEKYWTILPSFNINTIILQIPNRQIHYEIFSMINDLHVCAITYGKVVEQISQCETSGKDFNPFESIGNVAENMDIETMFNGVEVKNISAYDMIMSTIINQETNNKMDEYMNNIKESDVNEAAEKLNNVLESDNFNGNVKTAKLLSEMLSNIKDEVIDLKNISNQSNLQGKQGVEQLLGIAQKVASNMMSKIKDSDVSVLEIWDATSSLAKNTVQSDALNIVDNLIRSNIMSNINNKYQELKQHDQPNQPNQPNQQNQKPDEVDLESKKNNKEKKSGKKKNKN